jgi:alpha-L-fucosidase 2
MPANLNPPRYQNLSSPGRSASSVPLWRIPGAKASRLAGAHRFENLRIIDLYAEAGENRDTYPGDSSGVALLYRDQEDYTPYGTGAWWQWNNRMQVDANMGAGAFSLNDPYFNLYTSNLANIEAWTQAQDPGKAGACVPETMTYNGTGAP